jgi:tetratricopeptide (TPR) repeat protein
MLARINFLLSNSGQPGALARSQKYCEDALKVDPYYAEVYLLLGIIYEKNGRLAEASALYEKAFYCNPNLPEPMQRLEAANQRLGRANETGKAFERALVKYGDNLSVMVSVANLYFGRGEVQKALRIGERMIKLDPQNVNGYLVRAEANLRAKSFEPAWSDLQQAVMLDPKNIQAHILLGQLYQARGESDKARAEMDQVKELR